MEKKLKAQIAVSKSLYKEYNTNSGRTVYMDNGTEFQVQLYNPTSDTIAAKVYLNDKPQKGMLVLRPGERIWLERYLDTSKKLKFSTYEVDDNQETAEATKHNGVVKVEFYKEIEDYTLHRFLEAFHNYDASTSVFTPRIYNDGLHFDGSGNVLLGSSLTDTICPSSSAPVGLTGTRLNAKSEKFGGNTSIVTSMLTNATQINASIPTACEYSTAKSATVETGRVEKGGYSSQSFNNVDNEFCTYPFDTEIITILPTSRKPYTSSDLQKVYCTNCGRKLNTKYKFCPYCGTAVE